MNPVPVIIFNALVRRERVNLPEIGSLGVVYQPAFKDPKGNVMPPMNKVEISKKEAEDGVNIIGLIMQNSGTDEQAANRIYGKWLEESTVDGTISIENVGIIQNDFLTMEPQMRDILNPAAANSAELKKRSNSMFYWAIGLAVLVGAGISIGLITYLERDTKPEKAFVFPESAERASNEFAAEPDTVTLQEESVTVAVTPAPAATKPAETVTTAPKQTTAAQSSTASTGPTYYVVIGAYSNDTNAERFIAQSRKLDNTQNYGKLTLSNGKIMVYTSRWSSAEEARPARKLKAFPEAWIFKYRK